MVYIIGVVEPLPMATPFTDECYSPELVATVNDVLDSDRDSYQMWGAFRRALIKYEDCTGFDTAPREFVLCLMEERNVPEFAEFAALFGFKNYK